MESTIGDKTTMAEVMAALRDEAARRDPGEWVTGFGYDDTLLAEGRHPTREELDNSRSRLPAHRARLVRMREQVHQAWYRHRP